jgi:hypothetical protein
LALTNFRASDFSFNPASDGAHLSEWSLKTSSLGFAAHRSVLPRLQESEKKETIQGRMSEPHHISLSSEELSNLGIVQDARFFAFSYPTVNTQDLQVSAKDALVPDVAFLVFGGFMYFDSDMVLLDVRAAMPSEEGSLCFEPPQQWQAKWSISVGAERWRPVTLPALRGAGVRYFAWLLPGESMDGGVICRDGGFAYIFHEPSETNVMQAKLDVFFPIVVKRTDQSIGCPQCSRLMQFSDYSGGAYAGGWTCEFFSTCGTGYTKEAPMRWYCPHCQLDVCGACCAGLHTEGTASSLLQNQQ